MYQQKVFTKSEFSLISMITLLTLKKTYEIIRNSQEIDMDLELDNLNAVGNQNYESSDMDLISCFLARLSVYFATWHCKIYES